MMKPLTDLEREELMHRLYDPVKAREYYLRTRELKGRKPGSAQAPPKQTRQQIAASARARQRKELAAAINALQGKLQKLEKLITQRETEEAAVNRKGKAKKERAAKESTKPKSAAEKAKINRENEKLKTKAKQQSAKSGGSSNKNPSATNAAKKTSLSELKSLATKVRGQIAVAKQKLAAL